jgi:multisubunit Na+/H+ antiporter MnhB subunit
MNSLTIIVAQIDRSIEGELVIPRPGAPGDSTVTTVLNFAFALGAGLAMIVIIIAGIQFMLSQGDPGKSAKARNAIIYAVIGLVLCIAAFSIVRFVLTRLL